MAFSRFWRSWKYGWPEQSLQRLSWRCFRIFSIYVEATLWSWIKGGRGLFKIEIFQFLEHSWWLWNWHIMAIILAFVWSITQVFELGNPVMKTLCIFLDFYGETPEFSLGVIFYFLVCSFLLGIVEKKLVTFRNSLKLIEKWKAIFPLQ